MVMFNNKKLNQITGAVLVSMVIASAVLAIAGVWGFVGDGIGGKLITTFLIVGAMTFAVCGAADQFWKG